MPPTQPQPEVEVRRKNPLSGSASLDQLTVHEVRLGTDDDAVQEVRGLMEFDGDVDTVVLRVKENAEVERILLVRRLEVGADGGDPYGSGGCPSDGGVSGPPASIDDQGVIRTHGWAVVGNSAQGLVLRSPEGKHFSFTVDDDGHLKSPGRFVGYHAP